MDLYGYCLNDPVNFLDPFGLWGLVGSGIGTVSGFVGGITTGYVSNGLTGAVVGGMVGSLVGFGLGFVTPNFSHSAAVLATSAIVGGIGNYFGQVIGNWVNRRSTHDNLSLSTIVSSAFAGFVTAPFAGMAAGEVTTFFRIIGEGIIDGGVSAIFDMSAASVANASDYFNREVGSCLN